MPSSIKKILVLVLFPLTFSSQHICDTDKFNENFIENNPKHYQTIENQIQDYLSFNPKSSQTITIPIVFHVVWINRIQNIPDSVIYQQVEVLNSIFSAKNSDTINLTDTLKNWVGNFNIKFELAHRDPYGYPTKGINRKKTISPHFSYWNDPVKKSHYGIAPWPTNRYLNVWICDLTENSMGYAQFPGGPEETDGIVIDWQSVGNQIYPWTSSDLHEWAKGKVLVHEIGHWLNLFHPWGNTYSGCGEDYIPETPHQKGPIYPEANCPDTLFSECQDSGRLFIKHYMDYAGSSCMVCFTKNQVLRGLASLHTYRSELINSYQSQTIASGFDNTKIYPTYAEEKFYIEFPEYLGSIDILIYNLQGQLEKKLTIVDKWFFIVYIQDLSPGVYVVNIIHNEKPVFNKKILH